VGASLLVVSTVLAALAHRYDRFPFDAEAVRAAQWLDGSFEPIAGLCNEYDWWLAGTALGAGAGIALWRRRFDAAVLFALALPLRPSGTWLQSAVDRPRPSGFEVRDVVGTASYPSGHVLTAMTFAGLWFVLAPELVAPGQVRLVRVVAVTWVVLVAVSRMWAGVHWLSDAYGSVLWGALLISVLFAARPAVQRFARGKLRR